MKDCLFCKIAKGKSPSYRVYEDEETYAFLDVNPRTLGHVMVIPKKHSRTLMDMTPGETGRLFETVNKVAKAVKKSMNADGINIHQANEKSAGQYVPHVHVHVLPRNEDDNVELKWEDHELSEEKFKEISDKISKEL